MSSERKQFPFFISFFEAINEIEPEEQLPIYRAIAEYAFFQKEPEFTGVGKIVWKLIKPVLDSSHQRFMNGCKGGAPKGAANNPSGRRAVAGTNQELTENLPNPSEDKDKDKEIERESNKRTAKRFTPPSFDEVSEYILEMGYTLNATQFVDHYTANGWMVGRNNKMKDWRAALRNWSRREFAQPQSHSVTNEPQRRIYNDI